MTISNEHLNALLDRLNDDEISSKAKTSIIEELKNLGYDVRYIAKGDDEWENFSYDDGRYVVAIKTRLDIHSNRFVKIFDSRDNASRWVKYSESRLPSLSYIGFDSYLAKC